MGISNRGFLVLLLSNGSEMMANVVRKRLLVIGRGEWT
jgi:hypothetical protein